MKTHVVSHQLTQTVLPPAAGVEPTPTLRYMVEVRLRTSQVLLSKV